MPRHARTDTPDTFHHKAAQRGRAACTLWGPFLVPEPNNNQQ
jgi:hypothetical protein